MGKPDRTAEPAPLTTNGISAGQNMIIRVRGASFLCFLFLVLEAAWGGAIPVVRV